MLWVRWGLRARSSVGQSRGLIILWSQVRVLPGPRRSLRSLTEFGVRLRRAVQTPRFEMTRWFESCPAVPMSFASLTYGVLVFACGAPFKLHVSR